MAISRFKKIKNFRVFTDFNWPADLPEFSEKNLIYGWNGSGKSTLSNLFRAVEKGTDLTEGSVEIEIDGRTLNGSAISTTQSLPKVRVFNREFVEENISRDFEMTKPIFFLGKDSIDKQREIEGLKRKQTEVQKNIVEHANEKSQCEKRIEQLAIRGAREIKDMLRSSSTTHYNNYNKKDFKQKCEEIERLDRTETLGKMLDDEGEIRCRAEIASKPMNEIQDVCDPYPDFAGLYKRAAELLAYTVTSSAIERLKNNLQLGNWVKQGLDRFHLQLPERCPYCEQITPPELLEQLNRHFDQQYTDFVGSIDAFLVKLASSLSLLKEVKLPLKPLFYDGLQDTFELKTKGFKEDIRKAIESLEELISLVEKKKLNPFSTATLDITEPNIDSRALDDLREVIQEHNDTTKTFTAKIFTARRQLEESYVARNLKEYLDEKNTLEGALAEESRQEKRNTALLARITELEHDIVSHRPAADALTADLCSYLGRGELSFKARDTGYQIERRGAVANNLSEGERTAIAFLFFLKSLEDRGFSLKDGIVVIDDPVSSLDSNALFSAFGYMKERTKDSSQLFVLTHNFSFFRQVKNWFHHEPGQRKKDISKRPARFYSLVSKSGHGGRSSNLAILDPLLERYESEYHFLFKQVFELANHSDEGEFALSDLYGMPNIARRLLETFLAYRLPDCSGGLKEKLDLVDFDGEKKVRILRFLHTYSHSGGIVEPEHDPSALAEAKAVTGNVLELIGELDGKHFSGMVNLLK